MDDIDDQPPPQRSAGDIWQLVIEDMEQRRLLYQQWAESSEDDALDFMQDVTEMLGRGLSAHLELTEQAFLAGSDHATDPSTYLPDEFKTIEQLAAELPLTDEQYGIGADALNLWTAKWNEMSPEAGPTRREKKEFLTNLSTALRTGHDRDWIANAADLAGGFTSTDLAYYLPKPDTQGGER